ncbi:hypothetical protein D3C75_1332260 [compost metagenome]
MSPSSVVTGSKRSVVIELVRLPTLDRLKLASRPISPILVCQRSEKIALPDQ